MLFGASGKTRRVPSSWVIFKRIQTSLQWIFPKLCNSQQSNLEERKKNVFDTGVNCPFKDSSGDGRTLLPEI